MNEHDFLKVLRNILAAVREGNCTIAEIVVENYLNVLESEMEYKKKPWCWP